MLRLKVAGLSIKHIARKMGCSRNTVRRYLRADGWVAYKRPVRESALRGLESWLGERLQRHHGNADVVRQDLEREHGVVVAVAHCFQCRCKSRPVLANLPLDEQRSCPCDQPQSQRHAL